MMSNIRRRASAQSSAGSLRLTPNELEIYADYFSELFTANNTEREAVALYVILSVNWLAYHTLNVIILGTPNDNDLG